MGPLLHALKLWGGWVVVVASSIIVSAQGPLVFGLGVKGLGPGLDNFRGQLINLNIHP